MIVVWAFNHWPENQPKNLLQQNAVTWNSSVIWVKLCTMTWYDMEREDMWCRDSKLILQFLDMWAISAECTCPKVPMQKTAYVPKIIKSNVSNASAYRRACQSMLTHLEILRSQHGLGRWWCPVFWTPWLLIDANCLLMPFANTFHRAPWHGFWFKHVELCQIPLNQGSP